MKNVLFVGGIFSEENQKTIISKSRGNIQFAADVLQKNFVKGLDCFFPNLKIINAVFIGSYPFLHKELFVKRKRFQHTENSDDIDVSFFNFPVLKNFSRYFSVKKELLQNLRTDQENIIFIYCVHTAFMKAAVEAKKKFPNTKICLIVPDLPDYTNHSPNILRDSLKDLDKIEQNKLIKSIDIFILLSKFMAEKLEVTEKQWVVVEGIFGSEIQDLKVEKEENFTILYTGTLAKRYGILHLLSTFEEIPNKDFRLWICGDGDGKADVESLCKRDSRVKFLGQIPHKEILELQQKASVLVNPRKPEAEFTKYSFPSKTLEYLASGTPTILYPLQGMPEEYYPYAFIANANEKDGLKNSILQVYRLTREERMEFGKKARAFILNHKNPKAQVKKIMKYLQ